MNAQENPWHDAPATGPIAWSNDEVIVLELLQNLDGDWARILCLETQRTGWVSEYSLKVIV